MYSNAILQATKKFGSSLRDPQILHLVAMSHVTGIVLLRGGSSHEFFEIPVLPPYTHLQYGLAEVPISVHLSFEDSAGNAID